MILLPLPERVGAVLPVVASAEPTVPATLAIANDVMEIF